MCVGVCVCVARMCRVKSNIHLEKQELKAVKRLPCLPGVSEDKTPSDPTALPACIQLQSLVITAQLVRLNLWLVST